MKTIRLGVFETNSSSTHSLTITSFREFEEFRAGNLAFDRWNNKLVDPSSVDEYGDEFLTYDSYCELPYESFEQTYETPKGEKIVAFGYYGYDG